METKNSNNKVRLIQKDQELELAIETLQRFTQLNEVEEAPSVEHFELPESGSLEVKSLSALEKTLTFLMRSIFPDSGKEAKLKAIKAKLLSSIDTIKIAIIGLQASKTVDEKLKKRLFQLIQRYNEMVRKSNKTPNFKTKKLFLQKLEVNEIQLPKATYYESKQELLQHKFTSRSIEATSKRVTSSFKPQPPQKQEVELFRAKAFTLLSKEQAFTPKAIDDALHDLHKCPIVVVDTDEHSSKTVTSDSIISLKQTLNSFPGEEIELTGAFRRASSMSIPIKDSFRVSAKAFQTGFPDPLQSLSITFGDKFLPNYLLRPHLIAEIDSLLKKKQEIAEKLLPKGSLNSKAKELLQIRKSIFRKEKDKLFPLLKTLFSLILEHDFIVERLFSALQARPDYFEELSFIHAKAIKSFIEKPLQTLQPKLFHEPLDRETLHRLCRDSIASELQKPSYLDEAGLNSVMSAYRLTFGKFILEEAPNIFVLNYSEQLKVKPPKLTEFQKKLLAFTFELQQAFIDELEGLDPTHPDCYEQALNSILALLERSIQLFSNSKPQNQLALVDNLESYYKARFENNNEDIYATN